MFLLGVALVLLTLFMVWERKLVGECYKELKAESNDTSFKPTDLPEGYFSNGSFCADKV